jgi:FixJ family two-component response regulator
MTSRPVVTIVDDDESVRESLPALLQELGFSTRAYSAAADFLASDALEGTNCLVLDVAMPGMSGPELQEELTRRGYAIPIVFITAHGEDPMRQRLLERGAVACLDKPLNPDDLLQAVRAALQVDGATS